MITANQSRWLYRAVLLLIVAAGVSAGVAVLTAHPHYSSSNATALWKYQRNPTAENERRWKESQRQWDAVEHRFLLVGLSIVTCLTLTATVTFHRYWKRKNIRA
jgi:hypothetical protein